MLRSLRARPRGLTNGKAITLTRSLWHHIPLNGIHGLSQLSESSTSPDSSRTGWQDRTGQPRGFATPSAQLVQAEAMAQETPPPHANYHQPTKEQIDNVDLTGWETIIGLEIHAQLKTSRKLFSCMHLHYCHLSRRAEARAFSPLHSC